MMGSMDESMKRDTATQTNKRWAKIAPACYALAAVALLAGGGIVADHVRHGVVASRGRLMDGRSPVSLAGNSLLGDEQLPPEERAALADALRTGKFATPPPEKLNASPGAALKQTVTFHAIAPVGGILLTDQPHFLWERMADADEYRIAIFESDGRRVVESPALSDTGWRPSEPLERGKVYHWQAVARLDDRTVFATPREVSFRIASADVANQVLLEQQKYPDHHLLLAMLDARAGDVDEARRELHQAREQSGNLPVLEKLEASLATPASAAKPTP